MRTAWVQHQYFDGLASQSPEEYMEDYQRRSGSVFANAACSTDIEYGPDDRHRFDYFQALGGGSSPTLIFIHGGYWVRGDKSSYAFIAPEWTARGINVITLNYRLGPHTTIDGINADIALFMGSLMDNQKVLNLDLDELVVCGHSAGAYLAAVLSGTSPTPLKGACLISGLYDLRPLLGTQIGDEIGLKSDNIIALSPVLRELSSTRINFFFGEHETDAFKFQTQAFVNLRCTSGFESSCLELAKDNHFSIINGIATLESPIGRAILSLFNRESADRD